MLVWINGPFGGGKTQAAYELRRRLAGSVVCDPEHVGFGLHRMMPRGLRGDFQDLPAWREGVYEVLDLVLTEHRGTVIAPMTLVEPVYFREIVGRLRERGHDVRHFALLTERQTVLRRLRGRGPGAGASGRRREGRAAAAGEFRRLQDRDVPGAPARPGVRGAAVDRPADGPAGRRARRRRCGTHADRRHRQRPAGAS